MDNNEIHPDRYSYSALSAYNNTNEQYSLPKSEIPEAYGLRRKGIISKKPYEKFVSLRAAVRGPCCGNIPHDASCRYSMKQYDGVL